MENYQTLKKIEDMNFFSNKTLMKWFLASVKILNKILDLGLGVLRTFFGQFRPFLPDFAQFL